MPFEERGGAWQTRYYQHNAIENALEAIAVGKPRILLTLATGTGKTAIAFQIAWTLFQSRWNLIAKAEATSTHSVSCRPQHSGGPSLQRILRFP